MIRILQRGGIARTKFEFGAFNRKHKPKRNKKRALIVHRGVYSQHTFTCGRPPTHSRKGKSLLRHPLFRRQGLKRLGRAMSNSLRAAASRKGFVRRFLESATPSPNTWENLGEGFVSQVIGSGGGKSAARTLFETATDPSKSLFSPQAVRQDTPGPVPWHNVDLVDERYCFVDTVEPEVILKLYADIQSRMPEGLIARTGDYMSFDPADPEGDTGALVRLHEGKVVEVKQRAKKWVGSYLMPQDTGEKRKGWNVWELKGKPFNKSITIPAGSIRDTLKPGEAIVFNPDGTYSPFKGASLTLRSETGGDDFMEVVRGLWLVEHPEKLVDGKPKHQSIGYIPPASEVPEPLKAPRGWELVEFIDVKLASGPKEIVEGDVERKTSETVNKTDTDKE